jgi:hypothetical protein
VVGEARVLEEVGLLEVVGLQEHALRPAHGNEGLHGLLGVLDPVGSEHDAGRGFLLAVVLVLKDQIDNMY